MKPFSPFELRTRNEINSLEKAVAEILNKINSISDKIDQINQISEKVEKLANKVFVLEAKTHKMR